MYSIINMDIKPVLITESLKIIIAVILVFIAVRLAFPVLPSNGTLDIQLHDTYFVLDIVSLCIILFIFSYYFVQLIHLSFVKKISSLSFSIFCLLIFCIGYLIWLTYPFAQNLKNGFTIYPPLSGVKETNINGLILFPFPTILFPLILSLSFLWICIKFVKEKKKNI